MLRYKYFYCKHRMTAYLNGELPDSARRRVARYIDKCDDCYAEYVRQRNLRLDIQSGVSVLGRVSDEQLNRIWVAIEAGLEHRSQRHNDRVSYGYGIALMILLTMLLVPILFSNNPVIQAAPTQPAPQQNAPHKVATESPNLIVVSYRFTPESADLTDSVQNAMVPMAAPGRTPNPARQ